MQAKPGVIERLNVILTIELTAINQYFVQAEMCRNWRFDRLHQKLRDLRVGEMKDAQEMVRYILFLEGVPNLQRLNDVQVGEHLPEDLCLDLESELNILGLLEEGIAHCTQAGDYATRGMLEMMARDEQEHVDWLETQLDSIRQVGRENYLAQQLY